MRGRAPGNTDLPIVVSAIAPDVTINELIDPAVLPSEIADRYLRIDHRGQLSASAFALARPPAFAAYRSSTIRACRHRWAFSVHRAGSAAVGGCGVGSSRPIRPWYLNPSLHDQTPAGKQAASAFAMWFPIEGGSKYGYGRAKVGNGAGLIDKIAARTSKAAFSVPPYPQTHGCDVLVPGWGTTAMPCCTRTDRPQQAWPERLYRPASR